MRLEEFYKIIDAVAPKRLSDEYCEKYGAYDNSGLLVDTGSPVEKALFSLDLSFAAIDKAVETGANVIVTHHPAIYGKIADIRCSDFQPLGEKLIRCIKNGISLICMHLNLDVAQGGIDECLMQGVQTAAQGERTGAGMRVNDTLFEPLSCGGYGRTYPITPVPLQALAENMRKEFRSERILVYGNGERLVKKAASFCGAGASEAAVEFAVNNGADLLISSDFKHHVLSLAIERGLGVIALTHYASENYGFEKYYQKIRSQTGVECVYHSDANLL